MFRLCVGGWKTTHITYLPHTYRHIASLLQPHPRKTDQKHHSLLLLQLIRYLFNNHILYTTIFYTPDDG
jgi:hypothetical protein